MKERVRLGMIGLSGRGTGTMRLILTMGDVDLIAVCDLYEDRALNAKNIAEQMRPGTVVDAYTDYRMLVERPDIDAVLITSSWDAHGYLAVAAMNAGKYAAVECGGACSIDECWQIVRTYEKTGMPCMFLENCCYGQNELNLLRMIKDGRFGELLHVTGGYEHDLRDEIAFGHENRHYRYDNYLHRCGEFYPAHALGPMQKYLNINRGNRMLTLTSMASKARGLHEYIVDHKGKDSPYANADIQEGDIVTTLIKCAHGETMVLTHDTTLPRPYSRAGRVQGTKGLWMEDNKSIYFEGISPEHQWEKQEEYWTKEEYEHPLWREFRLGGIKGGHGGMDFLVLSAFFESVRLGIEPPIDAYDGATLMAITPLSEQSIAMGGAPVPIPDFTDGKWIKRTPAPKSKFALDTIHYDLF